MVVLRKRDTKGKCTTSPAGECPEYGPDAPQGRAAAQRSHQPHLAGHHESHCQGLAGQAKGKSPGGTDRPELANGKVFEKMKAE